MTFESHLFMTKIEIFWVHTALYFDDCWKHCLEWFPRRETFSSRKNWKPVKDRNLTMAFKGDHELIKHPSLSRPNLEPESNDTDDPVRGTFLFHVGIFYDFKSDYWIWNSSNSPVEALGLITDINGYRL